MDSHTRSLVRLDANEPTPLYCPLSADLSHHYVDIKRDGCCFKRRCALCSFEGFSSKSCDFRRMIKIPSVNIDNVILSHYICIRCDARAVFADD